MTEYNRHYMYSSFTSGAVGRNREVQSTGK